MRENLIVVNLMLITLFVITGCAENSQTGSMLTPVNIDKYVTHRAVGEVCLQTGSEEGCLKLTPKTSEIANVKVPVIHIHPQKLVYVFYHEGQQILRAERAVDTSDIVKSLTGGGGGGGGGTTPPIVPVIDPPVNNDPPGGGGGGGGDGGNPVNPPPVVNNPPSGGGGTPPVVNPTPVVDPPVNNNPPGGGGTPPVDTPPVVNNPPGGGDTGEGNTQSSGIDAHHVHNDGWLIWVNYDAPDDAYTLDGSQLNIRINGEPVSNEDISGFALVESDEGRAVQFFYPTGETDDSTLTIDVTGIVAEQETVSFKMNSPVETSPDQVTYQMTPL